MKLCMDCKYFKKGGHSICGRGRKMPKGGKSKVCNIFKPRITVAITRCLPKPYKCVEQLHNIRQGEEIWVLGTGPSLDDFPDSFFGDKIAIACKFSVARFRNCTYLMCSYGDKSGMQKFIRNENLYHLLKKFIVTLRYSYTGDLHLFGKYEKDPYYMRVFKDRRARYLTQVVPRIIKGLSCNYPGVNTIVHFGLQAAAIMGAKKIYMIGCEHHHHARQVHAEKGGIGDAYRKYRPQIADPRNLEKDFTWPKEFQEGISPGWTEAKAGTSGLAKLLAGYDTEVVRYFYKTGEEKIIEPEKSVDEIKEGETYEGTETGGKITKKIKQKYIDEDKEMLREWRKSHPAK